MLPASFFARSEPKLTGKYCSAEIGCLRKLQKRNSRRSSSSSEVNTDFDVVVVFVTVKLLCQYQCWHLVPSVHYCCLPYSVLRYGI